MRVPARTVGVLAAVGALAAAACGGRQLTREPSAYGAPTAEQAVRTFLDAAAREEYPAMGRVFGTRQGPAEARLGVTNVEQRMVILAGLMNFQSYELEPSRLTEPDPNRRRFNASLEGGSGTVEVPVVAVRAESGRWFVEQMDTEPLTGGSP